MLRTLGRARRPLIALAVLVAVLVIGYAVRASRSDDPPAPNPSHSTSVPSGSSSR